jgi:purine-binding chemotaxis protein CheW
MTGKERIDEIMKEVSAGSKKQARVSDIIKEFLIIETEGGLLGLQIEYLREAFDLQDSKEIIPIPFTPAYILGIINVRGEIVPVLSLERILGLPGSEGMYSKIVVIDHQFKIAFPVKEIVDLKGIDTKELKTIKDTQKAQEDQLLFQEFDYQEHPVTILDVLKLYSSNYLT